ncbi:MAG: hypothetical protein NVSMB6_33130 [Burkholderiaceae bacterium]
MEKPNGKPIMMVSSSEMCRWLEGILVAMRTPPEEVLRQYREWKKSEQQRSEPPQIVQ